MYDTVRVVLSVVKSDHKAVVAMSSGALTSTFLKTSLQCTYRPKTPSQNTSFLQHLAATDLTIRPNPQELAHSTDPQAVYDAFYAFASGLLDTFYLEP